MSNLILGQGPFPLVGPATSFGLAREAARHGVALPAEHVRELLDGIGGLLEAVIYAEGLFGMMEEMARRRVDRQAPMPARAARDVRRTLRKALGRAPAPEDVRWR